MFKSLVARFLTPELIKSIIRQAIVLVGGVLGYQAVMSGNDVSAFADAVFVLGATAHGWYTAHQSAQTRKAISAATIVLGQPTPHNILDVEATAELNKQQIMENRK